MSLSAPLYSTERMKYETPREGITIGGYIARRLHKTTLLQPVADFLKHDRARALAQIALYAAAASTSFGPARYQPASDAVGAVIETRDPETGARVTLKCEEPLRFSFRIEMDGGVLTGEETITGTTVGWRGLGMPAPTRLIFRSPNYYAELFGVITSELGPRLGAWKIRGYGALELNDSEGNHGRLTLDRSGIVFIAVTPRVGKIITVKEKLV